MKLYYWKMQGGNFGDDLNPLVWNHYLNNHLDSDPKTTVLGIGTLINDKLLGRIREAHTIHVFGTGVGLGNHLQDLPFIDDAWNVHWVRGPLSAQVLGLPPSTAVSDGAMLIGQLYKPQANVKKYAWSFMPHVYQARNGDKAWKLVCERAGIHYIDPRLPVTTILEMLSQTEVLIAEAMHGAIVADALRVPWIPVTSSDRILSFKWQDWCASLDIAYAPQKLSYIRNLNRFFFKSKLKETEADFKNIKLSPTYLSSTTKYNEVIQEMLQRIERFKQKVYE
ncbi:MAG: polysaccharide pyruvyl transferase family protein [Patescibacteria group bacterium]